MNEKIKKHTPCIAVCSVEDETGFCRGCFRTMKEITQWKQYSDSTREDIMKKLPERRPLLRDPATLPFSS